MALMNQHSSDETIAAAASAMDWPTGETPIAYTRRVGVL